MNATRGPELKPQGSYTGSSMNCGTRSLCHDRLTVQLRLQGRSSDPRGQSPGCDVTALGCSDTGILVFLVRRETMTINPMTSLGPSKDIVSHTYKQTQDTPIINLCTTHVIHLPNKLTTNTHQTEHIYQMATDTIHTTGHMCHIYTTHIPKTDTYHTHTRHIRQTPQINTYTTDHTPETTHATHTPDTHTSATRDRQTQTTEHTHCRQTHTQADL